jgi:hypothetical protein
MEGYLVDSGLILLGFVVAVHRVLQGAEELECQVAISGSLLKTKVKQTNIVAKSNEIIVQA